MQQAYGQVAAQPTLRFLTCGSVDDGKSTLIGRLLYEQKLIFEDHLVALTKDSLKHGTDGENIDFALLVDGLEAEREQGITIDVAYRYFATPRRSFIVADTPGHEQYTRNMATGASNSDLAVILVDARKGLLPQTFRHATIVSLLGIRHIVLAVNKIDLVGFDETVFVNIVENFNRFAANRRFESCVAFPISARHGDNVTEVSPRTPWHLGGSLLSHLEQIQIDNRRDGAAMRMAVQWVNRPNLDFRGFSGTIGAGLIRKGDAVVVCPAGRPTTVERIVTADGDLDEAQAGDAVTLVLADDVDVSRGDILATPDQRPTVADQFAAHIIWMGDEHLLPGRNYWLKIGARTVSASISEIKHRVDINSQEKLSAKTLGCNEAGFCNLVTALPIAFDAYDENRETGGFILIDRVTNATVAVGMIAFPLRRASNIHYYPTTVDQQMRSALKRQKPAVLWFTGLSGAGKSTIANAVEQALCQRGAHTMLLDGDNVRHGLNKDLGYTEADRVENIRRVGEVARLMTEAGLISLCAFISPFQVDRDSVRDLFQKGEFIEIYIEASVSECIRRDPKGLYRKANSGLIKNFTGLDMPYEPPTSPELKINTEKSDINSCVSEIIDYLYLNNIL